MIVISMIVIIMNTRRTFQRISRRILLVLIRTGMDMRMPGQIFDPNCQSNP